MNSLPKGPRAARLRQRKFELISHHYANSLLIIWLLNALALTIERLSS
jgi:hypothetical protein